MSLPAAPRAPEAALQGFKYFQLLGPLLAALHTAQTQRDRAGNRKLCYDQYGTLLLLYFCNPVLTRLHGRQHASTLAQVPRRVGVRRTSVGSRSAAAQVFDAPLLQTLIADLGRRSRPQRRSAEQGALQDLTAIDGSLLPALPKLAWAVGQDEHQRAAKRHGAFAVLPQVPVGVTVTPGKGSERAAWRHLGQPGGFYVFDRGYADYRLFQDLQDLPCRFIGRVQDNAVYEVAQDQPLSAAAQAAGIERDCLLRRLGTPHPTRLLPQPFRVGVVGTERRHAAGSPCRLVVVTNRLDLDAELVALATRYRWAVELFVRWLKGILGCRPLLSLRPNGVTLQVYTARIASLLISLWVNRPPTKRTYEAEDTRRQRKAR